MLLIYRSDPGDGESLDPFPILFFITHLYTYLIHIHKVTGLIWGQLNSVNLTNEKQNAIEMT